MVQISHDLELNAADTETDIGFRCSGLGPQCYEQTRGWSEWQYINASGTASADAWDSERKCPYLYLAALAG